ncbi:MAG: hypothetical protein GY849_01300 [Deltaproteobacteria bacterium]|nr:hypothetical protein [Deltaproteobacteria bacterium]
MNRGRGVSTWLFLVFAAAGLILSGGIALKAEAGEAFPCVAQGKLSKTIAPEAGLEGFSCVFKKWKGSETLHFQVAVKNTSNTPQRFKVNIFLDNDKAVGGLIPRKTKKGLVKPGQTAKFVYPVKGMNKKPKAITLIIKTMGK